MKRAYRQVARARAAAETGRAIVGAAVALFMERDPDAITLEDIAARAGVTLQTVLRRFGSKDRLFARAAALEGAAIVRARAVAPGDRAAAIGALVASYEEMGELNWRLSRFAEQQPALRAILDDARAKHRAWVVACFGACLPPSGAARARRIDALFAATDFYLWRLLRRDLGRSRAATEATMLALVEGVGR